MKNLFLKVILLVMMLTMLVSAGITVSAMEYPDEGYWANEAIDAAIANGLLQGKENGNIDSEANLTRAEMATIMVRAFGATVSADISEYVDLQPSAWYYDAFAKAVHMRVFEGDGTGRMRPNDNITREEVFTVVARALVLSDSNHSALNKFGDASDISSWARDYMSILAQKSYVNGDNLGNANPKKNITRAEFAQLMHNIFRTYYTKSGTYTDKSNIKSSMINVGGVTFKNVTIPGDLVIGDGNGQGTIRLENVTINGRLLVRGSARVELVKTTVGEMVVVNNYNTVVHFDNFRTEAVFDDIILNTEATFKPAIIPPIHGGGGSGGGGPITPVQTGYIVQYYTENINGGYSVHYTTNHTSAAAGTTVNADTTYTIEGFTYDPLNQSNYITGVVPPSGTLTLKVYYTRNSYDYTVKYYQQNLEDSTKYDEIIADRITATAKFGATITATEKSYTGFVLNGTMSTMSGSVTSDGKLELKVYYDRQKYTITLEKNGYTGNIPDIEGVYGQKIVSLLPSPEWTGYYLEGWYIGSEKIDDEVLTGPVTLTPNWVAADAMYKVIYYTQNADLLTYSKYDEKQYPSTTGASVSADRTLNIAGFSLNTEKDDKWSGTIPATGTLVLEVYYDRASYNYTVKYYQQNANDLTKYDEVTADQVVTTGKYGTTVNADEKTYTGFVLNNIKSNMSGVVNENGTLVLNVYYDRASYNYTVKYHKQNANDLTKYDEVTADQVITTGKYGTTVNAVQKVYAGFEFNASKSNMSGVVNENGTLVLNVYYDRLSYNYSVKYYQQNAEDLTKYDEVTADTFTTTGKYGTTVYATEKTYTGFELNEAKSNMSGIVNENGTLVLGVYYDRASYNYTVRYYQQNAEDLTRYDEVMNDHINTTGKYGTTVYATEKTYTGFVFNGSMSNMSGVVNENGTLVLGVYYDRERYTITLEENGYEGDISDVEGVYGQKIISLLPSPERAGYWLEGWYNGTEKIDDEVLTGPVTLTPNWVAADAMYKVIYYTQNADLLTYSKYDEEQYPSTTGASVSADTTLNIAGFDLNTEKDDKWSGTIPATGTLVLEVYYDRASYNYTVKYYQQNAEDLTKYDEVTADQVVTTGKYGTTVSADEKAYTGFVFNDAMSNMSGVVDLNGSLVLNVYYDRASYNYTVKYYQQNANDLTKYDEVTADEFTTTGKFGTTVSAREKAYTGFVLNETKSNMSGVVNENGTLVLNVYYDRGLYPLTIRHHHQNAEDLTKYDVVDEGTAYAYFGTITNALPNPYTGFEFNRAMSNTSGMVNEYGTLVLNVYYDRASYNYTVKYYQQNAEDLTKYDEVTADTFTTTGKYGTTVYATEKLYSGFTLNETKSNKSGVVNENGALVLNVYYDRNEYNYTIKYYQQNAEDLTTYDEVVADRITTTGKFGATVNADENTYTGFVLNDAKSNMSGVVNMYGTLVLNVYYDRERYSVTFDANGGSAIDSDEAYYGVGYNLPGVDASTHLTDATQELKGWIVNGTAYDLNATVDNVTGPLTITAVWGDKDVETKYGKYEVYYYKDGVQADYDGPKDAVVGSYTFTPDANKYGDSYILKSDNDYTLDIAEGLTTTFHIYYVTKPVDIQYVTVTFIDNGDEVGTVQLEKGNSMSDENEVFPNASWSADGYVKDSKISPIYVGDKEYTHTVNWGWWYNPTTSKWEPFTENTAVETDIEVSLMVKKFAANVFVTPMADLFPEGFPFDTYYETDTRFADTIKDILYMGAPLEALKQAGYWDTVKEKLVGFELLNSIDPDDNIMMQHIPIKFVQIIGEENLEDYIIDSAKDMFGDGENTALKDAFVTYMETAYKSGDPEKAEEIKNMMVNTIDHIIDEDPATIEELCREILKDKAAFKEITGYDYDDLPTDVREFAVEYIVKELSSNDALFNEIVKEYLGKDFAELPKDPEDLVVELASGMLDDIDFLESVIKDIAGVDVAITDAMTIKELFVKVAESKLESDDTFLEDAIAEIIGDGITVSIKDENGNYKTIQNFMAEIAVSKLGADSTLFADVVEEYVGTNVSTDNKSIRDFFVDVVEEDLNKTDSKLLASFIKEFAGYDLVIDNNTTTKDFLVSAIMTKLENESDLFAKAVEDITETTISVEGKDMQTFFKEVVAEKLSTDTALLGKVIYEVIGYDIDVDDSTLTRDFFVDVALTKLENETNFLDEATKTVLGIAYSNLDADAQESARALIATVVEDKLDNKGAEYNDAINLVFDGNGLPDNSKDVVLAFVAYRLMTDDTYYTEVMGTTPDEATRENEVQEYVGNLKVFGDNNSIKEDTGFDISAYNSLPDKAFIQLVKEEVVANDKAFEEITGYTIADITDENDNVKKSKAFIIELAEEKLSDEADSYLEDIVTDLGYDAYLSNTFAKDAITNIASDKIETDVAFREEIAKRFNFPDNMDWTDDARATILDITEGNLESDDTYLGELVKAELGYELSDLPTNAKEMIVTVAEDKLTDAEPDELNDTIANLGYSFTIENWSGDAKAEILKIVEKELKTDSAELEDAIADVGMDITITDWTADAKTAIVDIAQDMLNDEDNVYLNKVVTKLGIPSSLTADWSAIAKAKVKEYAIDKLETDDEFFHDVTGYYPSELDGKTSKDVLIGIIDTQLATNDSLFETATGWKVDELPATAADFMIETVLRELTTENSTTRKLIEEKAVDYLLNHHDELDKAADLAMGYLNDHPEERDELIDTIINELYRKDLDKLIDQLTNEEQFEINANTEFIAEGLKIKIEKDYNYEILIGSRVPEKVFEIYPEEKLIEIYSLAYNNLINQIDDAIVKAKNGETGYIDTGVTIIFNPVDDFYTPLYERLLELVKEKGENIKYYYYYEDNEYLQEFIKLLSTESLFEGSVDNETDLLSGYKLRSLDYYYDLFARKMTILGDDAILWYYNSDIVDDVEKVIDSHQQLILKYVNATADVLDRYATDGTLPSDNDKLSAIEKAFKERYPKIVEEMVVWYKDSDINKDYNDEDFQKVQDNVRKAFECINLTTDEYFDKILGFEKLQEAEQLGKFFEKVSDDEYKFEAKGNIVTFLRQVTDA